tara:strand:- start:535 stop:1272 length:738 start_codon:yes stop_codon:yes gene_type:complete
MFKNFTQKEIQKLTGIKVFTPVEEEEYLNKKDREYLKENERRYIHYKKSLGFSEHETIPEFDQYNPDLQNTEIGKKESKLLLETVMRWSVNNEAWLILIGGVGIGKTTLLKTACSVSKGGIHKIGGLYITAYDFDKQIKEFERDIGKKDNWIEPDEWINRLGNAERHLVIDDLGAGYMNSEYTRSRFERLIDIRYRNRFSTAFSTNLDSKALKKEVGDRIYSRFSDMSLSIILDLKNCEDMRSKL